ncbi:hypothetical protein SAMN06298216_0810 [Spirosomataceae bacterium TFI 002]|nr:hypothetical protein SAMN06298216_0810 [Spirosomataceae bacterium TFI 002]
MVILLLLQIPFWGMSQNVLTTGSHLKSYVPCFYYLNQQTQVSIFIENESISHLKGKKSFKKLVQSEKIYFASHGFINSNDFISSCETEIVKTEKKLTILVFKTQPKDWLIFQIDSPTYSKKESSIENNLKQLKKLFKNLPLKIAKPYCN